MTKRVTYNYLVCIARLLERPKLTVMEHLKRFFEVFDVGLSGHISKAAALKIIGIAAVLDVEYAETVLKVRKYFAQKYPRVNFLPCCCAP